MKNESKPTRPGIDRKRRRVEHVIVPKIQQLTSLSCCFVFSVGRLLPPSLANNRLRHRRDKTTYLAMYHIYLKPTVWQMQPGRLESWVVSPAYWLAYTTVKTTEIFQYLVGLLKRRKRKKWLRLVFRTNFCNERTKRVVQWPNRDFLIDANGKKKQKHRQIHTWL